MHRVQHFLGRFERKPAGYEIGFEGIEAVLQGHGKSPFFVLAPANLVHLPIKGYTAFANNIYLDFK
jgi:hypothetical protein